MKKLDADSEKLVRDFLRYCERKIDATPTLRVPQAPHIPPDVAAIAAQLERDLAIRDVEDTGVHRIEVLTRALESAKPRSDRSDHHRSDSFVWWRRKQIDVLLAIIAALVSALGFLAWKLIELEKNQPREPARMHEVPP